MRYLLWHAVLERASSAPDRPAVEDATSVVTYGELAAWSERLAAFLAGRGVGRGDRVGMFMPKSARSVITMLGTSRTGAAYVPVDPAAPALRAAFILGNARVRTLVTSRRLLESLAEQLPTLDRLETIIIVDDGEASPGDDERVVSWGAMLAGTGALPAPASIEDDPAYILYTSGSTGTPKGVVISHRNALAFVDWAIATFDVRADDRLSNHAPLHFDLSVFDIYAAIHTGACVFLIPDRVSPFPTELARWIEEKRITIWYSVPSALVRLLKQGQLERFRYEALRVLLFAGEVFPVRHLREVMERFPSAAFYNLYGPTETNVCTWLAVPRPIPEDVTELSIGIPCANYDAFAVTDAGTRATAGEEGELVVRGPGVMLGYWGLPERTQQSIVPNPLHADFVDPVYRTGDIVRILPDGTFGFLGRRDHMVKTRGYRVELGEIEHVLHQFPNVRAVAVVPIPDEEVGARLQAAIVAEAGCEVEVQQLAAFCRLHLPAYAIPERFVLAADLPSTSTGKIDRRAIADALQSNTALARELKC